jgi:hypothetical protein
LNVPRTTSPAPWTAAAAAFMGFVVCFEVGTVVFVVPAGAVVALVLAFMAAVHTRVLLGGGEGETSLQSHFIYHIIS